MVKAILAVWLLALAGCASVPPHAVDTRSPCYANEASYECQVERYHNVNVQ
ncbi:MAG: hypothetical protein ACXWJM_12090 [Ramlibacter sp.]